MQIFKLDSVYCVFNTIVKASSYNFANTTPSLMLQRFQSSGLCRGRDAVVLMSLGTGVVPVLWGWGVGFVVFWRAFVSRFVFFFLSS